MKILQIGLGSMGKRRVRNALALGLKDIIGFDMREDRRKEAEAKYQVKTTDKLTDDIIAGRDVFIISTSPDKHNEYMWLAVNKNKPAFIEASVIIEGLAELAEAAEKKKVFLAPSCTMRFHVAIKTIKEIVLSGRYGKITNFVYHMGQYLPDWHPWEDIKDFYVSNKKTSAGREMVPFELTWLLDITGFPEEVSGYYGNTFDMGIDIDDTYAVNMKFKGYIGTLTVDVVSRFATRSLTLNLEHAQIRWNWEDRVVKLYEADSKRWVHYFEPEGQAAEGYNKNIVEEMYINELRSFTEAVKGTSTFPNTLEEDIRVLDILEKVEKTNKGFKL